MFTQAITRKPGVNFGQGITTAGQAAPNYALMGAQHTAYVNVLRRLGLAVVELEALPAHPDAYFVEDVAVVTPEIAVITNPGAAPRQGETESMGPVLASYRPLAHITPPGTLDGGDVLIVDKHCLVGISERTNQEGAQQLGRILGQYGYTWTAVPVAAGLHFKSSVNHVGGDTLLVTADFAGRSELAAYEKIVVAGSEAGAANVLFVNGSLLIPAGFPQTKQKLVDWGANIIEMDVSEAGKMDGGLTCMSLRF